MMNNDPRWFWIAVFEGGGTAKFYADSKALAFDHAGTLARDFGKSGVRTVMRLKHTKNVTPGRERSSREVAVTPSESTTCRPS